MVNGDDVGYFFHEKMYIARPNERREVCEHLAEVLRQFPAEFRLEEAQASPKRDIQRFRRIQRRPGSLKT